MASVAHPAVIETTSAAGSGQAPADGLPDFASSTYKDAYSRINAIVIEGEQEAHDNYISLGTLIPDQADELAKLARMELKHMKGFTACANNLSVTADMPFAKEFFSPLHSNFQKALAEGKVTTCLLIQAILIEAFAISAYHIYIPVADPFARRITEGVVKDEYTHLNYGQEWLKANLYTVREELEQANRENLPLVRKMLDQVADDAAVLLMDKEDLMADFLSSYQEALMDIGFTGREIAKLAAAALVG
ncbi:aldehyde oxygenase (deformylating) [Cyanobium sp. NS01]|uniref:aldehyde oxygenase (deformylating) n=1 Tax=Cyanobium sp. NS01 TaxID=261284 RepID=UPI00186024BC|nr:aldehyde oxygenase (deformylating) [Cyanobium sp. NS01]QNI70801.1 long-chain fatty aldehyde decarbonylase/aldehyde-deformylating oxygenase [Cyanobium sp. NS01]